VKRVLDRVCPLVHNGRMTNKEKIRTVAYLDRSQREALDRLSEKTGAPIGELVRRAVADYLKKTKGAA
jgi:Ribbon-helix-helix domain